MKNSPKLLTFEWNEKQEILEIHGTADGLKSLVEIINKLIASRENEHEHMMSVQWGGQELSNDPMNPENRIINHVKINKWDLDNF
jgi:hypothetical protein